MNTRLQVEHCVTEMITGVDLVQLQIEVAQGKELSIQQDDLKINGHSIELRICAEDPSNNFLPDTGTLRTYKRPEGDGIRIDDAYEEGMDIPIYYDPMIGKLIVWDKTRDKAIEKLIQAIDNFPISGICTTLPFGRWAVQQKAFIEGKFDTHFIQKYFTPEGMNAKSDSEKALGAIAAVYFAQDANRMPKALKPKASKWKLRRS